MFILGISAFYHDSAAALTYNGKVVAAAQEERFTRKKHDPAFPSNAIEYCLNYGGITMDQLDAIAFYDKPYLKFERLLESFYSYAPVGIKSFLKAMPLWIKEKIFLKRIIREELDKLGKFDRKKTQLLFPEHHLSHAASAFYPSPFDKAAILTIDGVGEWATASICVGEGRSIKILRELHFPHSLGLLYSAFTYYLGFKVNSGEYKLMGLAPYGNPNDPQTQDFIQRIKTHLVDIKPDGSICLEQSYFNYVVGLRMANDKAWEALFGFPRREPESTMEPKHCNLAFAIQAVTEEIVLKIAATAQSLTASENLCLAGGVALNCVANGKIQQSNLFKHLFIQPAAGDAGGALGAALAAYHLYFEQERNKLADIDDMQGAYLGPEYSDLDIEQCIRKYNAVVNKYDNVEQLCEEVAKLLEDGQVIGWFQGRMEYGPRALGNRSILGDPRNVEMQRKLNLKIKFRESFRPFAPAILADAAKDYFEINAPSPYMLLVQPIREKWRITTEFDQGQPTAVGISEQLKTPRSTLPAITHVDYSARIQTVTEDSNFEFWSLLQAFYKKTGCPVLINTSFNVRGEPIVNTPEEAFTCFMQTNMDYLVLGNYLFDKSSQAEWSKKITFEKD